MAWAMLTLALRAAAVPGHTARAPHRQARTVGCSATLQAIACPRPAPPGSPGDDPASSSQTAGSPAAGASAA